MYCTSSLLYIYEFKLPVSNRLCSALSYISVVNMKPESALLAARTCLIFVPTHSLSCSSLMQFAHHLSILLVSIEDLSSPCSLCSFNTCKRNPAFNLSNPNSDKHFRILDIRKLLWDEPISLSRLVDLEPKRNVYGRGRLTNKVSVSSIEISRRRRSSKKTTLQRHQSHAIKVQHDCIRFHQTFKYCWVSFHNLDFMSL